jgi:TatD DNase family protein
MSAGAHGADALIDIGANLAHESFDADLNDVLSRARQAGVERIILTGSSRDSALKAAELARQHRGFLYATAGLHPHHASEWSDELAQVFRELAAQPEVVSLGECGLDYFRDLSPREHQRRAFITQLELAVELKKPLFLHQRDAHEDFLGILREYRSRLGSVVVHCFTDTHAALKDYVALDCHIGITGWICDERRGTHLLEAVRDVPDDRLLIETDAPYLMPRNAVLKHASGQNHRRNEPCFLPYVARAVATARQQSLEHVARITTDNARAFFGLDA